MFKKFVSLALCVVFAVSLCACSPGSTQNTAEAVNQEYIKIIRDAANKLNTTYTDYIIANTLSAPDGDTEYIEVVHDDISYTEYSVDSDDNLGTLQYGSSDTISYALSDWLTADGKYYLFSADDEGNSKIYNLNDSYKSFVEDRVFLYMNTLLDNVISIKEYDDLDLDLGDGEETFKTYKMKVKGEILKDVLGASSYGVYKSLADDKETDANVAKLCGYYLEDLDMNLTFSDANVIVGIDSNDILKYVCIEAGGLGTRLYFTKAVVATKNSNLRETPDLSTSTDFASTLKELADYIATFDSYDEAVEALNSYNTDIHNGVETNLDTSINESNSEEESEDNINSEDIEKEEE